MLKLEIAILIFYKKIVRIDFNFILGVVAVHHGSSNKIINSETLLTMSSFRFLFIF